MVRGYRVLVHPGVKPFLIVGHLQSLNFETAISSLNRSNNCCNSSEFSDHTLCFTIHRQVLITLERVPLNEKTSRLAVCVVKLTRNNDARASHACDAAWRGEGPIKKANISCNDNTCTSKFKNLDTILWYAKLCYATLHYRILTYAIL